MQCCPLGVIQAYSVVCPGGGHSAATVNDMVKHSLPMYYLLLTKVFPNSQPRRNLPVSQFWGSYACFTKNPEEYCIKVICLALQKISVPPDLSTGFPHFCKIVNPDPYLNSNDWKYQHINSTTTPNQDFKQLQTF